MPGWLRELLFLVGVGYLGATTFQYLKDNGASTIRQWVIVLLATVCIIRYSIAAATRSGRG